jgi:hypothetical protein
MDLRGIGCEGVLSILLNEYQEFFAQGMSAHRVKLTTYHQLVPWLIMCGTLSPIPLLAFSEAN